MNTVSDYLSKGLCLSTEDLILEYLSDNPSEIFHIHHIGEYLGVKNASYCLSILVKKGKVLRKGRGIYTINPKWAGVKYSHKMKKQ